MSKVYLSSTYRDLIEQREAVYHALHELGHDVVAMEEYVAADSRPVDKCLRDVANADVYVGVFAWRYGFVPDDDNPEELSVTEMEYRQAYRSGVPRLVFLLHANAPWVPELMDSQTKENGSGSRINRLREELATDRLCSQFSSSEELARKVATAVQRCLAGSDAEPRLLLDADLPARRFAAHMRAHAGAMSERQAEARYIEIALQQDSHDEQGYSQVKVGPLKTVVAYPENYVILGPHGSGKTTLLLQEAKRLADNGAALSAYVSLAGFDGGDGDTVLELAAEQNRLNVGGLLRSWRRGGDRVRLLVDDADEQVGLAAVTAALSELHQIKAPDNNIVAAVPGKAIVEALLPAISAQRLLLLPLELDTVTALLNGYGRDDLSDAVGSWSDARALLLTILCQPDLLAAWAQAPRGAEVDRPSLTRIVGAQLHGLLTEVRRTFDNDRVVAPALGLLAYRMLSRSQPVLAVDDDLYDGLSDLLDGIYQRYYRRRNVMPADWNAEMLLRSVARSPVLDLNRQTDGTESVTFTRTRFADWYAAWHVGQLAGAGADPAPAVVELTGAGAEGALTQLVDTDPEGAKYVDHIATADHQMAERVWLACAGHRKAPSALQDEFERLVSDLSEKWAGQRSHPHLSSQASASDPRHRLQTINRRPGLEILLDFAADPHPLVRGSAEYLLMHSAEDAVQAPLSLDKGALVFRSNGPGQATIAGHRLLSVPAGSAARLLVATGKLETDPFDSADNVLRFLPLPAAALVAGFLSDSGGQNWLRSVATTYVTARLSHDYAVLASKWQLGDLAERLSHRAIDHAAIAEVIGEDLGLRLRDLPPIPGPAADAAADAYSRLRYSFDARASESRVEVPPSNIDVQSSTGTVVGNMTSMHATSLSVKSRYANGYYAADLAQVNLRTSAGRVTGDGKLLSLVVGTLHGSTNPLPIQLQVNIQFSAGTVENGTAGGIVVHHIANDYPNWEVNCLISVGGVLEHSSLLGVVVGEDSEGSSSCQVNTPK
jgi:hypothetical protein